MANDSTKRHRLHVSAALGLACLLAVATSGTAQAEPPRKVPPELGSVGAIDITHKGGINRAMAETKAHGKKKPPQPRAKQVVKP